MIDLWEMLPPVIGGSIAALIGGIPAWIIARWQSREALRRDAEQRRREEKAQAFSLFVKLHLICETIFSLRGHIEMCLNRIDGQEWTEPWQVLQPIAGLTQEANTRFDPAELAVIVAAGETDYMQDVSLLAHRNAASYEIFQQYSKLHRELIRWLDPTSINGPTASGDVPEEGLRGTVTLRMSELNQLAEGLRANLSEDVRLARKCAERFGPVTAKYFQIPHFVSLEFPSEEEMAKSWKPAG